MEKRKGLKIYTIDIQKKNKFAAGTSYTFVIR